MIQMFGTAKGIIFPSLKQLLEWLPGNIKERSINKKWALYKDVYMKPWIHKHEIKMTLGKKPCELKADVVVAMKQSLKISM